MMTHVLTCQGLQTASSVPLVCVSGFNYHHPPQLNPRRHYIFTITNKPLNTSVSFSSWIYHLEKGLSGYSQNISYEGKMQKIQLLFSGSKSSEVSAAAVDEAPV